MNELRLILPREHRIKRDGEKKGYTIGSLFSTFDDSNIMSEICDTLEDEWRNYQMGEEKIPGDSCIPSGQYTIKMEYSKHFNKEMPFLQDVNMFKGIMIHPGNDESDTNGCILLGINNIKGKVTSSLKCFNKFMKILEDSGQTEWQITIID
jgi:hypothetical protein